MSNIRISQRTLNTFMLDYTADYIIATHIVAYNSDRWGVSSHFDIFFWGGGGNRTLRSGILLSTGLSDCLSPEFSCDNFSSIRAESSEL